MLPENFLEEAKTVVFPYLKILINQKKSRVARMSTIRYLFYVYAVLRQKKDQLTT